MAEDEATGGERPTQPGTTTATSPWRRRLALAFLVGLAACLATLSLDDEGSIIPIPYLASNETNYLWLGCVVAGLPQLLAIWGVFRRQPLAVRWPRVLGLAAGLSLLMLWSLPQQSFWEYRGFVGWCAAPLVVVVMLTPILQIVHWRWRWWIVGENETLPTLARTEQFSLRQLLAWFAGTAAFLALARWAVAPWIVVNLSLDEGVRTLWGVVFTGLALPWLLPCLRYCLGREEQRKFAVWAHLMAVVVFLLQSCLWLILDSSAELAPLAYLDLGCLGTVLVGLGTLRLAGFRLTGIAPAPRPCLAREFASGWRPRWWQSPVPYLTAALLAMGPFLGHSAWRIVEARQQARYDWEAAAPFRALGLTATFREGRLIELLFPPDEPISDAALKLLQQYHTQQYLTHLDFSGRKLTDEQLQYLSGLNYLTELNLSGTPISDAGLEHLRPFPTLQILDLSETAVSDQGMKTLQDYPNLTGLGLRHTQVSDVGVHCLARLRKLAGLDLGDTAITDESLKTLKSFYKLTLLNLSGTQITDAGLTELLPLGRLFELYVADTQVTDQGIALLTKEGAARCRISKSRPNFLAERTGVDYSFTVGGDDNFGL